MKFEYNNVLIYGYGDSGKAVERVLQNIKVNYSVYDKSIHVGGGAYILKINAKVLKEFDLIVISPGVSIYDKYVRLARKLGIKVIGELEFAYRFTTAKLIGVTGTNGKTSTVGLITSMLKTAGYKADSYGNIGVPLSSSIGKSYDYIVCEVSSFQLESIDKFVCDISVILNIDEDHLDRHKSMRNYINCKLSISANNTDNNIVIINDDDPVLYNAKDRLHGKVLYSSATHVVEGVYIKDSMLYYNNGTDITPVCKISNKFRTEYIDNIMCAVCVAKVIGIDNDIILKCIKSWSILPHRLEFVTKSNGITYINDSKSTNVHSVAKAISCVRGNIILMLGGQNKGLHFEPLLSHLPRNVKGVVAFGQCSRYIFKVCKKYNVSVYLTDTVSRAVRVARSIAVSGDTILFSPGCASFDAYKGYTYRGDDYKNIVLSMVNNEIQEN